MSSVSAIARILRQLAHHLRQPAGAPQQYAHNIKRMRSEASVQPRTDKVSHHHRRRYCERHAGIAAYGAQQRVFALRP